MIEKAKKILKEYYGYDNFRDGQTEFIHYALNKQNTLAIMPTGSGKSLCYQIPGLILNGTAIIVSPLISLMKDQVDSLQTLGIRASYINSTLSAEAYQDRVKQLKDQQFDFIYIAPERFERPDFLRLVQQLDISFLAFDEAHCISQWGHDFRPSYRNIIPTLRQLSNIPFHLALTATATPEVVEDIQGLLNIQQDHVINTGFARDNLAFRIVKGQDKLAYIHNYINGRQLESGIIYVPTRKLVDTVASDLTAKGVKVATYHAGLSEGQRQSEQNKFIQDEVNVMIATNAFGMGIDKSNVRFVIHYSLPMNVEAYYQEAGRAGRDGELSDCILLYSGQDSHLQKYLIDQSRLDEDKKVLEYKKLQAMINYCHTDHCLQTYMLDYFHDQNETEDCGRCSNCQSSNVREDRSKDAQMVLSCVMRMEQRFGAGLVAKVLKGSKDKKIKQFGFEHLTTYGLMKGRTEKEITQFIHFLVADDFLSTGDQRLPILQLTSKGAKVLKGEKSVWMRQEKIEQTTVVDYSNKLFEKLRRFRKELADREHVPPYVIFSDATLKEMCRHMPNNKTDMLDIKGVGIKKYEQYGEDFLTLIKQFLLEEEADQPSHLISFELYQSGESIQSIASKRGVKEQTIASHLFKAYHDGKELNWDGLFTAEVEQKILDVYNTLEEPGLKDMKETLGDDYSYTQIKAVGVKHDLFRQSE